MRASAWSVALSGIDGVPVEVEAAKGGGLPRTMRAYDLGGTPSTVLIDKGGRIRLSHLGRIDDMALGAVIGQLLSE